MGRFHGRILSLARAATAAAVLLLGSAGDKAQGDSGDSGGELDISTGSFGVGGVARAGEWVGLQVVTTDRAPAPRQILIRASIPDVDGDIATYERSIASNPGTRQGAWLYFRLPMSFGAGAGIRVSVSEAEESAGGFRAGRLLAQQVLQARNVLKAHEGLIGVIGGSAAGLDQYTIRFSGQTHSYTPGGHEGIEVSPTIAPDGLSDRWMGLMQFDALVWTGDQPEKLDTDRAAALREWVRRGGHLVVVMPPVGQSWIGNGEYNPLEAILPRVTVNRLEGVDLSKYRPLLANDGPTELPLPQSAVVQEFTPAQGAAPEEAMPIFTNPPGVGDPKASVVVRRLVGDGAVTLVGIDLLNKGLQLHGRPEADVFWHRVLGHRGKLYAVQELNELPTKSGGTHPAIMTREQAIYDAVIGPIINMSTSASQGVLLGFVVFIAYWLVAAPVSYGLLRKWGLTRHSWLAYAGAAGLFTGIAWGGVSLIKPTRVSGAHVTLLDYVYGQETARTRTWATLLIPWYGAATVSIGEPGEPRGEFQNVIAPWDSSATGGESASFPDVRPYTVEARSPDSLTFPTRSTVKQLQFDWAGGPRWTLLYPVVSADDLTRGKIRLLPPRALEPTPTLSGILVHELPGPLKRVRVVVVRGQVSLRASSGTALLSDVEVWQRATDWNPKEPLDLGELTRPPKIADVPRTDGYLKGLELASGFDADLRGVDRRQALEALAFIGQFPPPETGASGAQAASAERQSSHGWDLGRWFTQPCIIVVGQLGDPLDPRAKGEDCPTPIYVDGKKAPLRGVTVIRWIYPLAADPPAYQ